LLFKLYMCIGMCINAVVYNLTFQLYLRYEFYYLFTSYLLTYSLTQRNIVFPEELTGSLLAKKFPGFYGNQNFITAFTSACHLSLS